MRLKQAAQAPLGVLGVPVLGVLGVLVVGVLGVLVLEVLGLRSPSCFSSLVDITGS